MMSFVVNWAGTGYAAQETADSVDKRGLRAMVNAVHKVNASHSLFRCRSEV